MEQARTQAAMDEVGVGKAQRDLNRGQQLFAEGVLPAQQKEDLEWQMKSAQAKLEKSKSDLAAAEIDLSYAVIRRADFGNGGFGFHAGGRNCGGFVCSANVRDDH